MITNGDETVSTMTEEKNRTQTGHTSRGKQARTDVGYWRERVRPRLIRGEPTKFLYVRLFDGSREAWMCLDTPNRAAAAAKARDHWVRMRAIGLPALLAELAPEPLPERCGTVGEAIAAASQLSTVRPISFLGYVKRLRQVTSEIAGIQRPKKVTSRSSKAMKEWRARVDAVSLDVLTAKAVNAWKAGRIHAAGDDLAKRRSATVTADAAIRLARAVFGKDILAADLARSVRLPNPLPFAGVEYGKSHKRFVASVDPARLFASARSELEATHPQQFLAFSLCLLAGLRRSEADLLTWEQVNFEKETIQIASTDYFEPKSEDATREIELDAVAVDILRRAKQDNPHPVFVLKGREFIRQNSAAPTYRADVKPYETWTKLVSWLGAHGVKDLKPIHALRKMAGSLVFEAHGIEQARGFLGHGDVSTTSRSYVAKTKRVVISLEEPQNELLKVKQEESS